MPFDRPELKQIIERVASDFDARLPGVDARLPRSNIGVLARVQSGAVHGLYGYLEWLALQLMPDTADEENMQRWASIWGLSRNLATKSTGLVIFTGIATTIIPAGTVLVRSDGLQFVTLAEGSIGGDSTIEIQVEAQNAGVAGNTAANSNLNLSTPIANIDSTAKVNGIGLGGGFDDETDESLRARLIERIQQPPHGGASFDYIAWAKEVTGVNKVFVFPRWAGEGTVGITFLVNDDNTIPDAQTVIDVQTHIDTVRPVTAQAMVFAPTADYISFQIKLTPDTVAVRAAVEVELKNLLIRDAQPGMKLFVSKIREAISIAAGESNHVLVYPADDIQYQSCAMPVMVAIQWL